MTYKEKKRSMFLGLPWTFTTYTVTDESYQSIPVCSTKWRMTVTCTR